MTCDCEVNELSTGTGNQLSIPANENIADIERKGKEADENESDLAMQIVRFVKIIWLIL